MYKITEKTKNRIEYTQEGYSYIKVSRQECFDWGGYAVCDHCGEDFLEGRLVFVLASCVCPQCFKEFDDRHTKYEEDLKLQEESHEPWYSYHLDR